MFAVVHVMKLKVWQAVTAHTDTHCTGQTDLACGAKGQ